ncbi:ABC transporter permease [Haloarculaceae archaeon H-GB2-1]|nr:ABC transporter permease [Haloarculaceae archaeon H-GB11]MEA5406229.1 ABC transporter permease [Haloarculaceae archaeon H-GB2-1]
MVFEFFVFIAPFLMLLRISLSKQVRGLPYEAGTFTFEAYSEVLSSEFFHGLITYSFKLGIIATLLTVVLATFYAYAIWRSEGLTRTMLLFSVVLPLLTTLVIKTYAWVPLLAPRGTVNELLMAIGVLQSPIQLVPNTTGVIVGQVYIVFPYATLAVYSVLSTLDWEIVEAARDLGASRPRSFFEVVLPQAMPGVAVATVVSFAWSVGAYAAPGLLGAGSDRTFAIEVETQMLVGFNWPVATALSAIMLVLMFVSVVILYTALNSVGGDVSHGA